MLGRVSLKRWIRRHLLTYPCMNICLDSVTAVRAGNLLRIGGFCHMGSCFSSAAIFMEFLSFEHWQRNSFKECK